MVSKYEIPHVLKLLSYSFFGGLTSVLLRIVLELKV